MAVPILDEQAALLRAICAEPDEDTPRLVYADWLQEYGDEVQAQFIRDSIRLARMSESEERQELAVRLWYVEKERGVGWLRVLGVNHAVDPRCVRGFTESVVYHSSDAFFDDAALLFSRTGVRDLGIYWGHSRGLDESALHQLATMPELRRLRTLRFANRGVAIPFEGWKSLITSPHLRELRLLSVVWSGLTDDHARILADCANLTELTGLDLAENRIEVIGALALLRSPTLVKVTRLSLNMNSINLRVHTNPILYSELIAVLIERFGSDDPLEKPF